MTTAAVCIVLLVIVLFSIKSYLKKLKNGCCGGSDAPQKIKPADANPAHYAYHIVATIEGMTCSHCAQRIEHAFNEQPGMMAKVNLGKNRADVYSKTPISKGDVQRLVAQAGYLIKEIQTK